MKLFIKMVNQEIIDHPSTEENLLQAFEISEITPEFMQEHNYVRFERVILPPTKRLISEVGYELCADGVVRNKLVTEELTQAEKVDEWVRGPRNFHLARSDWTQMPDSPLSAAKKAEWAAYRQELRDMTTLYADIQSPSEVVPPTRPDAIVPETPATV